VGANIKRFFEAEKCFHDVLPFIHDITNIINSVNKVEKHEQNQNLKALQECYSQTKLWRNMINIFP
jgi:hypothetical protein